MPTVAGTQLAVLAGQRFDLGQADVVDLLGAQLDRRVVADRRRVGVVAAGDPAQPGLVVGAGVWLDVVAERVAVRPGRRPDVALDDPGEAALPLVEVGALHPAGVGGVEQRVLGERRREPAVDLVDGLADGEIGRGPAVGDTLAVPAGKVAEVRRDAVVLADEPLGDVGVGDRQLRDPDRQARLHAEDRVGAELVEAGPAEIGPGIGVPGDHLPRDPVVGREPVDGDGLGPRGELAGLGDLARPRPRGRPPRTGRRSRSRRSCGPRSGTCGAATPGSRWRASRRRRSRESPVRRW